MWRYVQDDHVDNNVKLRASTVTTTMMMIIITAKTVLLLMMAGNNYSYDKSVITVKTKNDENLGAVR